MIELLVMRHAKSDWSVGTNDFDRPLNDRGQRAAVWMANWLADRNLHPSRVVSSSAVRARATAEAVIEVCTVNPDEVRYHKDLYLADLEMWLHLLAFQMTDRMLICGHNPGLDDLVEFLSATDPELTGTGKLMTTAAVAHFRFNCAWHEIASGSGELVQIARPSRTLE